MHISHFKRVAAWMLAATVACLVQAQTNVIAHRGFWKTEGSAQNSIASLLKADSIGCYGSEFDVWLTKDGQLVVNHDGVFKGHSMEGSTLQQLCALTLANGEHMPSLRQYLEAAKQTRTRLILELKELGSSQRETEAVEKTVEMVKSMGLEKRVEYISFSLHAVKEFVRVAPEGTPVFYLKGDLQPGELKELGCAGPDYHFGLFEKHPEMIEACHRLGMKVNAYTVNKKADMKFLIEHGVDFITTDHPLQVQALLR